MMKQEFEKIAGYEVSTEDYNNTIEPMYMATSMNKQEFVKTLNRKQFEKKHEPQTVKVGVKMMPNGTWMTYDAELIKVDIKTGKTIVRRTSENHCYAEINFDVNALLVEER